MKYLKQILVLNQHLYFLQDRMQSLSRMKETCELDPAPIDAEINAVAEELKNTSKAMNVLSEVKE